MHMVFRQRRQAPQMGLRLPTLSSEASEIKTPSVEALEIKPTVFDHVENAVAPIAAQVKEAAEPVTSGISKAVEPVGEKAGEALEDAKTAVTGFASGVGKSIGGFFGGFGKKK